MKQTQSKPSGSDTAATPRRPIPWRKIALGAGAIVILGGIGGGIYGIYRHAVHTGATQLTTQYWAAHESQDPAALAELVPDQFWQYLADKYDYTEESCLKGMALAMEEDKAALGDNPSCTWEETDYVMGSSTSDAVDYARRLMQEYGLSFSGAAGVSASGSFTGDAASQAFDMDTWVVKMDGDWYCASAMEDFSTMCESGYVDRALYESQVLAPITQYWDDFYNNRTDALAATMPAALWDYIDATYGMTQAQAEEQMGAYIQEIVDSFGLQHKSQLVFSATMVSARPCTDTEIADMRNLVPMELDAQAYLAVEIDYAMDTGDDVLDGQSTQTLMVQIDGQWYVFDGMYYFLQACAGHSGE